MKHPTKWNLANLNMFVSSPVAPWIDHAATPMQAEIPGLYKFG